MLEAIMYIAKHLGCLRAIAASPMLRHQAAFEMYGVRGKIEMLYCIFTLPVYRASKLNPWHEYSMHWVKT